MTGTALNGEVLYTVREAAKETGLAYWTIWDYFKRGKLMKTKIGGRTVVRHSELKKLIRDEGDAQCLTDSTMNGFKGQAMASRMRPARRRPDTA